MLMQKIVIPQVAEKNLEEDKQSIEISCQSRANHNPISRNKNEFGNQLELKF